MAKGSKPPEKLTDVQLVQAVALVAQRWLKDEGLEAFKAYSEVVQKSAELDVAHVLDIECIDVVADRHADVPRVAAQILARDHAAASKSQRVGRAQTGHRGHDDGNHKDRQPKEHNSSPLEV